VLLAMTVLLKKRFWKKVLGNVLLILYGWILMFAILFYLHPISLENIFSSPIMNVYAMNDMHDSFVMNVSAFCKPFNESLETHVDCVVSQISNRYNYKDNGINRSSTILTPTETIVKGGICRDSAVLYNAIFKNLGYDTNYVFTENHVFNVIYTNDEYCTVDQYRYDCTELG
jgi:hypothetical protein